MSSQSVWDAILTPPAFVQTRIDALEAEKANDEALLAQMDGDNVTADVLAARQAMSAKIAQTASRIDAIRSRQVDNTQYLYENQSAEAQQVIDYLVANLAQPTVMQIARSHKDVVTLHTRTQEAVNSVANPAGVSAEALNRAYLFALSLL